MFKFRKESENDSIEYKENILYMNKNKFERYITQMNNRLFFGNGRCHYFIGLADNGDIIGLKSWELLISLFHLLNIVSQLDVVCDKIKIIYFHQVKSHILIVNIKSENDRYLSPEFITYSESDNE